MNEQRPRPFDPDWPDGTTAEAYDLARAHAFCAALRDEWADVDATLCAGSLYVSNTSTSDGTARLAPRFVGGHVETNMRQSILGAEGACLSRMAEDSNEDVSGPFAYVPVSADATCESLARDGWPVTTMK